jgi:hypothetical protein
MIYITKQEKVSIYYLSPFLGEFVRAKRKPNFGNVIGQRKNSPQKSWISFTLLLVASREQIRPVENVILLPVKYTVTVKYTTYDFMFVNRAPPPRSAPVKI